LPGCGIALIAPARLIASLRLLSPRCSSCSREITVRLAGVCSTLGPNAEPALAVDDSSPLRVSTTRTVSSVVGVPHRRQVGGGVQEQRAQDRQRRPAQARGVEVRFHFFTACKATPQWQGSNQKGTNTRVRAPAVAGNLMENVQCNARAAQAAIKAGGPRAPNVPLIRCGNARTAPRSARHTGAIGANSNTAATSRVISRAAIRQ
jgi:hypothetical protein